MKRLSSIEDLIDLRAGVQSDDLLRAGVPMLTICAGTGGQASGSNDIMRIVKRYIIEHNLQTKIGLRITGCQGFCEKDPFIVVEPGAHLYPKLKMADVPRVIESALNGTVEEELLYKEPWEGRCYDNQNDIPFFRKQTRTILGSNQHVDPIRIVDYVRNGGYTALQKVLSANDPAAVIQEVLASGLRGRGGAGFSTGKKWEVASAAGKPGQRKYVVCNCDEGDPGAYMDRSLLEGNPHGIIEGMLIAGFAIGANQGFIYVRSEYPLAIKHTVIALRQAAELGLLGENILSTRFSFGIEIVRGAGAFVCGEETALIRSIMGYVGEPRQRPPYPVQKGLWGCPTCINNVETLANIPVIITKGATEYAKVGVPLNTGTKIFSLVGKIKNTGLVEVPMGITINTIVNEIGGGPVGKAKIKAVQTGGPSGGCIPARMFDLPIDYDSLVAAGSIMGSGGMIVMDEDTCMVDVAKYFMNFLKDESCGKCFTCRKGTQRMYEILEDISNGLGTHEQLNLLEELAQVVKDTSMCGLGQSAPNPVLSTLRYFRDEYEKHIYDRRCEAFVCRGIVGAPCATACPIGTEAWRYIAHIQRGEFEDAYRVIREANPFPSVCARVCNHPCEDRCTAGTHGSDAIAIRALKRFVTDRIDPSAFVPHSADNSNGLPRIAVVGSGPAGLTAAHFLSLKGYRVTVFESDAQPGGMLFSAIPSYRLPHEVIKKEISSLLDENITLKCNTKLGRDITLDSLFEDGYKAIFVAIGAHKSLRLKLKGEDQPGVYPSIQFLKAFNLRGEQLAKGSVGVVGGGNSALDAARIAIRQPGVQSVTIYYRRTRDEMPAFAEEIEAAIQEGIQIEPLVSPTGILSDKGRLSGIECVRNELGELDASGRRRPVAIPGTQNVIPLDTLIVAISEGSDTDCVTVAGANRLAIDDRKNTVIADLETLCTNRPGVFAGGDVVTGPNTVVDAIAAGKRAAVVIDRYVRGEELKQPSALRVPRHYIEPLKTNGSGEPTTRAEVPRIPIDRRKREFSEVELSLSVDEAMREAARCLRCDLEFTRQHQHEEHVEPLKEHMV
jgi:NADH-quinone oxidoreductase subunit F